MKSRKPLLLAVVALVAAVAGAGIWRRSLEKHRLNHLEQRLGEIRAELDVRCGPQAVLRGTPVPGDAWDDYGKALTLVAGVEKLGTNVLRDGSLIAEALRIGGPAVDPMQSGARRSGARRIRFDDPLLLQAGNLATVAVCRARALKEEGNLRGCLDLLVDLCRFAEKLGRVGAIPTANVVYADAFEELRILMTAGLFSPAECAQAERELEVIDERLPTIGTARLILLERIGQAILDGRLDRTLDDPNDLPRPGWRHLYSGTLLQVSGFDRLDAALTRLGETAHATYDEEIRRGKEFHNEIDGSGNACAILFERLGRPECGMRAMRGQARLLRMAAHYGFTGEFLELDDPFGTKLRHRQEGGRVRLWGVGASSLDAEGVVNWLTDDGDQILEIPRRP